MHEPSQALQDKIKALLDEAYAAYAAQGIPAEEVTDEAEWEYLREHLSEAELFELWRDLGERAAKEATEYEVASMLKLVEDLQEELKAPGADPERGERIRGFQRMLREQ